MGESAHVVVVPGAGTIKSDFSRREIRFSPDDKFTLQSHYHERRVEHQCVVVPNVFLASVA
jgi:hypothetical protein